MQNLTHLQYLLIAKVYRQNVYFASFLFLCLTWFELVWNKPGNPRHIGIVFLTLLAVISLLQKFYKKPSNKLTKEQAIRIALTLPNPKDSKPKKIEFISS